MIPSSPLLMQWSSRLSSVRCQTEMFFCALEHTSTPYPEIISRYILSTLDFWTAHSIDWWMWPWTEVTTNVTNLKAFLLPGKVVRISFGLSAKLSPTARWQYCKFTTNARHVDQGYYFLKDWQCPYYIFQAPHQGQKHHFSTLLSATAIRKANHWNTSSCFELTTT